MNALIDSLENLLFDAQKTKGLQFVQEPLWYTWSLEKFGTYLWPKSSSRGSLIPYSHLCCRYLASLPSVPPNAHRNRGHLA